MKKITYLLLFVTSFAFAQETVTETTTEKEIDAKVEWYFGAGAIINPDYNINRNLLAAGVKGIPDVMPAFMVGWNTTVKRLSVSMEFGGSALWRNRKKDGSQLVQVPASLRMHYVVTDGDRLQFSAGANVSFVSSSLSVFSDDTEIDMGNINPDTNTGYLLFRNNSWFAGPSATLKFVDEGKTFFSITAGYDFGISNSKWKSDYARIANPVKENGSRMFINITMPFFTSK